MQRENTRQQLQEHSQDPRITFQREDPRIASEALDHEDEFKEIEKRSYYASDVYDGEEYQDSSRYSNMPQTSHQMQLEQRMEEQCVSRAEKAFSKRVASNSSAERVTHTRGQPVSTRNEREDGRQVEVVAPKQGRSFRREKLREKLFKP